MNIFVLHCGRSSLQFQIINVEQEELIVKGVVEKIGTDNAVLSYTSHNKNSFHQVMEIKNHDMALKFVLNALTDKTVGVLQAIGEIEAVGHMVVHGGERFSDAVLITPGVMDEIQVYTEFAPLHNPFNVQGIEACSKWLPDIDQVAVFDTAFHTHLPEYAFLYGLPYDVYEQLKIRRYGFHGISHRYVSQQAAKILNRNYADFKAITCHLCQFDKGASIAAVKNGLSVDTSMGMTPLEGLMMGTRCGNIDPAIVPYLMDREHLSSQEIDRLMNTASGLKGISKTTNDMQEIEEEAEANSELHQLALAMFCYQVKKYIGTYFAVLGGTDAVVFTASIGEHSPTVRRNICDGLECFGIILDEQQNQQSTTVISRGSTPVLIIATNEELAIAQETYRIVYEKRQQRRAEQETLQIQASLSTLTDADKAKITLLWSHHQEVSPAQLFDIVQREMRVNIDLNAFEVLLENMGFAKP
jgi:acetate kinase